MKELEMTLSQLVDKIEKINKNMMELHIYKKFYLHFSEEYGLNSCDLRQAIIMIAVIDNIMKLEVIIFT